MPEKITIVEMSPRDGLQNEKRPISTANKIALVDQLSDCGFTRIEVTSFVSPKQIPQLADAKEVMLGIIRNDLLSYAVLTPNLRGFEDAIKVKSDQVAIFTSASEGFCQNNINCSIDESLARFAPVLSAARALNIPVRGYVSCVTDCPYDGPTQPSQVADVSAKLIDLGCFEVSLGDTLGVGTPESVSAMLTAVTARVSPSLLAGHFHDTNNDALDNISVSLEAGLKVFDSSAGGLGGCPYAPGAKGNVATEQVVELLHREGYETGIDVERLNSAAQFAKNLSRLS